MKKLLFCLCVVGIVMAEQSHAQTNDPTPCGSDWLCGSAAATVAIRTSRTDGFSISKDAGVSVGNTYTEVQCCAASSNMNACALSGESNSSLCFSSRVGDWFKTVRFNREK